MKNEEGFNEKYREEEKEKDKEDEKKKTRRPFEDEKKD